LKIDEVDYCVYFGDVRRVDDLPDVDLSMNYD